MGKTIEQLELEARKAEQRAKDLRAKAKKLTQAEEAKLNIEILKAVECWNSSRPHPIERQDLPRLFAEWAEKNRIKYQNQ